VGKRGTSKEKWKKRGGAQKHERGKDPVLGSNWEKDCRLRNSPNKNREPQPTGSVGGDSWKGKRGRKVPSNKPAGKKGRSKAKAKKKFHVCERKHHHKLTNQRGGAEERIYKRVEGARALEAQKKKWGGENLGDEKTSSRKNKNLR